MHHILFLILKGLPETNPACPIKIVYDLFETITTGEDEMLQYGEIVMEIEGPCIPLYPRIAAEEILCGITYSRIIVFIV